jgi:hypothetical protein
MCVLTSLFTCHTTVHYCTPMITCTQVDKKQTRTAEERDAEIQQEEAGVLPDVFDNGMYCS